MKGMVNIDFIEPQDLILAIVYGGYLELINLVALETVYNFTG